MVAPAMMEPRKRFLKLYKPGRVNPEARTVELSFSSDEPVDMGYGREILSHRAGAVRTERLSQAAPLLYNHNRDDLLGVVERIWFDAGKGRAEVRFGKDDRGEWAMRQVEDNVLANVSMMYRVYQYDENARDDTYTAVDWEPYEISLVTVPADITVGIGREAASVLTSPAQAIPPLETIMTEQVETTHGAPAKSETPIEIRQLGPDPVVVERRRTAAITALCEQHKIDARQRDQWIADGIDENAVGTSILGVISERYKNVAASAAYLDLPVGDRKRYSIFKAINAAKEGKWDKAGLELECHRSIQEKNPQKLLSERSFYLPVDIQTRDLTVATANAGGYLVETQNVSFIDLLRNRSVLLTMGATQLSGLTGNVTIPKQTAAETAYWLTTEATAITESQMTLGQLSLTPKTVGGYTELSRQLMLQSSPSAEAMVMSSLAQTIATAVDAAGINGNGSGGAPQGIIGTSGLGSVTGTSIDYAKTLEFQTDVAASNFLSATSGYVATPAVAAIMMQRVKFTSTASPLWEGGILDGTVCGFRAMSSNQMPSANLLFGDFRQVIIASWGMLEVEVNPYANFAAAITGVRAIYTVDIGLRYAGAFSLSSSTT